MRHIMLDLETMANGPQSAIAAVGAVAFDPTTGHVDAGYYTVIDLQHQLTHGATVDGASIRWWLGQTEAARSKLTRANLAHICNALLDLSAYLRDGRSVHNNDVCVWGNGAAFDNVILRSAYVRHHVNVPWQYWHDRCYRTLAAAFPAIPKPANGTAHHALDDARNQAQHLCAIAQHAPALFTRVEAAAA